MTAPRDLFQACALSLGPAPGRAILLDPRRDEGRDRSAGWLLKEADLLASRLARTGLTAGGVALLDRLEGESFLAAALAVWARDGVVAAADPTAAQGEIEALRSALAPRARLAAGEGSAVEIVPEAGGSGCEPPPATALIKITSGTTGRPRGIAFTAAQLLADGAAIIEAMEIRPDDVNIAAIPLSHSYGLANLVLPLLIQGTALMPADPGEPEVLVAALGTGRPAVFPGVPALYGALCRPGAAPVRRRGLRLCLSAGALLPSEVARRFGDLTGLPVRAFYGSSETGGICYDDSPEGDAALSQEGCVGRPLPGVEITLDGETGQVIVRGAAIGEGYVMGESESGCGGFEGRTFRTADAARWAQRPGRPLELVLTGRLNAWVNVAGRKVDPGDVERALRRLEGVRDAVVLGVPDPSRGEAVVACLEADEGLTRDRVLSRLREELAPWKLPRRLVFVERLPRTPRGKTDREALRRLVSES